MVGLNLYFLLEFLDIRKLNIEILKGSRFYSSYKICKCNKYQFLIFIIIVYTDVNIFRNIKRYLQ